jgi:indoleamine 2,3-dioxygenase
MAMEVVNILETPPTFFNLVVRFALSLFASLLAFHYPKPVQEKCTSASFDIDPRSGFFPPKPLPKLHGLYAIWEAALDDARGNLSLGEDDSDDAVAKRPFGQQWRAAIAAVRFFFLLLLPFLV